MKTKPLKIRLPDQIHRDIKRAAKRHGLTMNAEILARIAFEEYLRETEEPAASR